MSPLRLPAVLLVAVAFAASSAETRKPSSDDELQFWLRNMVTHGYARSEMGEVLGLDAAGVEAAVARFKPAPIRATNGLLILPYPGGRHPRIGFLDGAIDPQRETKVSIFTPWDSNSYVVVDVPEAIFSNLGLTYLAHTHIPTVWSSRGLSLPVQEWKRGVNGQLESERVLPNNIAFGATVTPSPSGVRMELWLRNGTDKLLTGLRVQNCVMLKGVAGFNQQTNTNKVFAAPFVATRSEDGRRWIITGWEPLHRVWENPPVPCMHSDPQFPDCPPGGTVRVRGWLSFYDGTSVRDEMERLRVLISSGQKL